MKMRVAPLLAQFAENIYPATVEKLELSTGVYGEFFQWSFSVKKKGVPVTVTGLTSTVFNPKSKFYRWSSAVTGKEFQDGEELDTDMLHGAPCRVYLVVKELDGGGSINQVERVLPREEPITPVADEEPNPFEDDSIPF
jgi:hypothetical protein